jgi:hypothetical protein
MKMALIDDVKIVCDRLAPLGWRALLLAVTNNALDISQPTTAKLRAALTKVLLVIDRSKPGFEDFSLAGQRAVTATQPALSLLYHAFASPLVTRDHKGRKLQGYPTPKELDLLENFIFSLAPLSLNQFIQQNGGASKVAIVVFSSEYRPAADTVDGRHADLTFSRTGIARVGTARPRYDGSTRGFWAEDEGNSYGIRVLPARFSVWLSVKQKGRDTRVSPILDNNQAQAQGESERDFWVPVHKLFPGKECVQDLELSIQFHAKLFNLKLQRIHWALKTNPLPTEFPFVIIDGEIANWSTDPDLGPGWLAPTVRRSLVDPAIVNGKPLTYRVKPNLVGDFAAVEPPGKSNFNEMEINPAPSYVHGRTQVENGRFIDLNDESEVIDAMKAKEYDALHYIDYTGEGWVQVEIPNLATTNLQSLAAYALVSAPDFFPSTGQFEVSEWARSSEIPDKFRGQLWHIQPTPLSETRLPANLQLPGSPFTSSDTTITAVIATGSPTGAPSVWPKQRDVMRASSLPDDAAGVFAPGWDVAVDRLPGANGAVHLAAYGLGSPFPEDAKLCAALSTFWSAVAPDVFRTFATPIGNTNGTIAPLTDEEIGQSGALPWDGIPGPRIVPDGNKRFIETTKFLNADYVRQAVENRFSIRLTSRITAEEYQARILAISRVYSVVGTLSNIRDVRNRWFVLSFRAVTSGTPELQAAQSEAGAILSGNVYRIELCERVPKNQRDTITNKLERFPVRNLRMFFASPESVPVLSKGEGGPRWGSALSEI